MGALCWLAENDIIRDLTGKIQQMTVCEYCEITDNTAKGEDDGMGWIVIGLACKDN